MNQITVCKFCLFCDFLSVKLEGPFECMQIYNVSRIFFMDSLDISSKRPINYQLLLPYRNFFCMKLNWLSQCDCELIKTVVEIFRPALSLYYLQFIHSIQQDTYANTAVTASCHFFFY